VLQLKSSKGAGVTVTKLIPESLWGLRAGDVIAAVDGRPVTHVNELMNSLRASKPAAVKLHLLRGGAPLVISVAAADYARIIAATSP